MNKADAKKMIESFGVNVIRVSNRLGSVIVTIAWADYLKVRDADISPIIKLNLI